MKRQSRYLVIMGSMVLGLVACDMKKQLTEMHDSTARLEDNTKKMGETTAEMNETTKKMAEITGAMKEITAGMSIVTSEMNGRTKKMSDVTGELYDAAKLGDSSIQRREALRELWRAHSSGRKIIEATKYFISFEYQLYSGMGQDESEEKKSHLIHQATLEFFKDVNEFLTSEVDAKPLDQAYEGTEENKEACLNAIAVALHQTNRKQDEYIIKNKLKEEDKLSMYKIIVSALTKKAAINKGEIQLNGIPEYEREVLIHESAAIKLLQARHNFMAAVVLSEISEIKKGKIVAGLMLLTKWNVESEKINLAQSEQYLKMINSALGVQNLLKQLGHTPKVNSMMSRMFRNAVWVDAKDNSNEVLAISLKSLKEIFAKFLETLG